MPRKRDDRIAIWDIINSADLISRLTAGVDLQAYRQREELRAAVERKLEIVGEASRRLSANFRAAHPEIPWRGIIAQRNMLAHEYDAVDDQLIWQVASRHVPQLASQLRAILAREFPDDLSLFRQTDEPT